MPRLVVVIMAAALGAWGTPTAWATPEAAVGPRLSAKVTPNRKAIDITIENPMREPICVRPSYSGVQRITATGKDGALPRRVGFQGGNPMECILLPPRGKMPVRYQLDLIFPNIPEQGVQFCYALPWNQGEKPRAPANTTRLCVPG